MQTVNHEGGWRLSNVAWQDYSGSKDYSRLTSRFMREDSVGELSMTDIMRAMPSKRVHHADDVGKLVGHLVTLATHPHFMFQPKIVSQNALHNHPWQISRTKGCTSIQLKLTSFIVVGGGAMHINKITHECVNFPRRFRCNGQSFNSGTFSPPPPRAHTLNATRNILSRLNNLSFQVSNVCIWGMY